MRTEPYPLDDFELEIVARPLETMHDLVASMLLSARLAALGRPTQLSLLSDHAMKNHKEFNEAIEYRCKHLRHELEHSLRETLGSAFTTCNDAHCLLMFTSDYFGFTLPEDLFTENARLALESVVEDAECIHPDPAAVYSIEAFNIAFPLPEDMKMVSVDMPVSDAEMDVIVHSVIKSGEKKKE